MPEHEPYEAWLAHRRATDPPAEFADRVMARLDEELAAPATRPRRIVDATWFHVAACLAASVIFVLRLGCVYSLFFIF